MRIPNILIFVTLLSFVAGMVIPYWEGRSNSESLLLLMVPFLFLFVSFLCLAGCWVWSLFAKRDSRAIGVRLLLAVVLFGTSILIPPAYFFHRGFRHYAANVLTADEWRSISRMAQERLGPEGRLPGPGKNLWDEKEHRALWTDLCAATKIQKLDPSLMIFVLPGETEVLWGGALDGHRGVIIFAGKGGKYGRDGVSQGLPIAEDITTIVSAD